MRPERVTLPSVKELYSMETNTIHYTCTCGKEWKQTYYVEIKQETKFVHLSRIVARGTPPNDGLCTCGKTAEGRLETSMPGYKQVVVKHLTPVSETPHYSEEELEQQYEELVQYFIAQETAFISWERMDAIEETSAKLIEQGQTIATWKALSGEQQAELLGIDPTVVPYEQRER